MNLKTVLFLSLTSLLGFLSTSPRSLEPNKQMIDTIVTVIDSIPAMESFQMIKPSVLLEIEGLRNSHTTLQTMLQSNKRKAKTAIEKAILTSAFKYILNNTQYYEYDVFGYQRSEDYKDVSKGKITEPIRSFLSLYDENYLVKEIDALSDSLENNWTCFIENPPTKQITIQVENPNYRGYNYNDYYTLNRIERDRLFGEYAFILSNNGIKMKETYPMEVSYIMFPEIPNYRVIDNYCKEVYDKNGDLVYVPILERQSDSHLRPNFISEEIMRLIYLKDYQNNKYNILSASSRTQNFLSLWIGRKHGLSRSAGELSELESEAFLEEWEALWGLMRLQQMKQDVERSLFK